MAPKKRVACTCLSSGCNGKTFLNEFGERQPGVLVHPSTRKQHEDTDAGLRLDCRNPSLQVSYNML